MRPGAIMIFGAARRDSSGELECGESEENQRDAEEERLRTRFERLPLVCAWNETRNDRKRRDRDDARRDCDETLNRAEFGRCKSVYRDEQAERPAEFRRAYDLRSHGAREKRDPAFADEAAEGVERQAELAGTGLGSCERREPHCAGVGVGAQDVVAGRRGRRSAALHIRDAALDPRHRAGNGI